MIIEVAEAITKLVSIALKTLIFFIISIYHLNVYPGGGHSVTRPLLKEIKNRIIIGSHKNRRTNMEKVPNNNLILENGFIKLPLPRIE